MPNYSESKWRELVEEMSVRSGIPQQVRESVIQYHLNNRDKFNNLNRRELATALLYIHMKNYTKQHRSLKELSGQAGADVKKVRRYVLFVGFENGLKPTYTPPEDYVSIYGARMNLEHETIERGAEIAHQYRESAFSGASPRTIAASAVYLASREKGHKYTQRDIANVFGLADYTVREVSARMKKFLGSDLMRR